MGVIRLKTEINRKGMFIPASTNLSFLFLQHDMINKRPFKYWVGGFRKLPFLLTISTQRLGGSEKVQKPAYVIYLNDP